MSTLESNMTAARIAALEQQSVARILFTHEGLTLQVIHINAGWTHAADYTG